MDSPTSGILSATAMVVPAAVTLTLSLGERDLHPGKHPLPYGERT
jgi:hypothetical protein